MAKTKYNKNFPERVYKYIKSGLWEYQAAAKLGISVATFEEYKIKKPEFIEAIKKGKDDRVVDAENQLYKKMMGYDVEEKHTEIEVNSEGQPMVKKIRTVKKHIPGDTGANIFFLTNQKPEKWKNSRNIDHTTKGDKIEQVTIFELPDNGRDKDK